MDPTIRLPGSDDWVSFDIPLDLNIGSELSRDFTK